MTQATPRERFDSMSITLVVLIVVIWTGLNLPCEYGVAAIEYTNPTGVSVYGSDTFSFLDYEQIAGGFPFQYYLRYEDDAASTPQRWSVALLAFDIAIGLIVIALVIVACTRSRRERDRRSAAGVSCPWWRPSLLMAVLLAVGVGVTGALVPYVNDYRVDESIASEISQDGAAVRYAIVPKILINKFPDTVLSLHARIRSIALVNPPQAALDAIGQSRSLRALTIIGDGLKADDLTRIASRNQLNHLAIKAANVDEKTKAVAFGLATLRRLAFIQVSGLSGGILGCENLPKLKSFLAVNSDLPLRSVTADRFSPNLETLALSRPTGGTDNLVLHGMNRLKNLNLGRSNRVLNSELVTIDLNELPSLERLDIEAFQKYSVAIRHSPRLVSITSMEHDTLTERRSNGFFPTIPWFESIALSDLISLRELNFDGLAVKHLSVDACPNLAKLMIGRTVSGSVYRPLHVITNKNPDMVAIVHAIGTLQGPPLVELSSLPLRGVDLSPLARNGRIKTLILENTGIEDWQLEQVALVPELTSLDVRRCTISDHAINALLEQHLPLKELLVSGDRFERLAVVNQPHLRVLDVHGSPKASTIDIRQSPGLATELLLGDGVRRLSIQDARSLIGLSVNGPLPQDCLLRGFRDLRYFAIGGPEVTDELCDELWHCAELDHLTIAYGNLSRATLSKVGRFSSLTALSLPGSKIDDDLVLGNWQSLGQLRDVNLSDTAITGLTVEFLSTRNNLQKLAINNCFIDPKALSCLVEVKQLIELDVAGIGMDSQFLAGCLNRGVLDRLDISNTKVTNDVIDVLAGSRAKCLRFLGLQGCGLTDVQVRRLLADHDLLMVDVRDNPLSEAFIQSLAQQDRLLNRDDHEGFLRHLAFGEDAGRMSDVKAELDSVKGRIDHNRFAAHRLRRPLVTTQID